MQPHDNPRALRDAKLRQLEGLGLPCLPNRYGPTRPSTEIRAAFESLEGSAVRVAGRLMRVRLMGKAAFAHIQDAAGEIQLYFKRDVLGDQLYEYFKLLDIGDIVGAEGTVFRTRTGETSIEIRHVVLLAKARLPLPDKFHGLADVETRYRQRYLDLISNPDARQIFRLRSGVITGLRRYLDEHGFMEVETPILQPLYGGAAANPFVTHYAAIESDVYLRIATELYLKRLIVGGLERVYEIGKDFRNEGVSRKNSPEFTMLEFYAAYLDYRDVMDLFEDMISCVAAETAGSTVVNYGDGSIELRPPWRRLAVREALEQYGDIRLAELPTREDVLTVVKERGIPADEGADRGKLVEELVSTLVEPHLIQPTFLCDFPVDYPGSLLAKRKPGQPDTVERFEVFVGGMELANAFTELNDPEDQARRMEQAAALSGESYSAVDNDFLQALEYGMPPTGGLGFGIDRLVMLLSGSHHIRETILFPLLKSRTGVDAHAEP